jgi:hypothetical protein
MGTAYRVLVQFEDKRVDRIILILKLTLKKYDGRVWIGCMWLRIGTSGGLL